MPSLPTSYLKPIPRSLPEDPSCYLSILHQLAHTYAPPKVRKISAHSFDSGYSSETDEAGDEIKGDEFERNFTKSWLLNLVRRIEEWLEETECQEDDRVSTDELTNVLDVAAGLLTSLSETSPSGSLTRLVQLSGNGMEVNISLCDELPESKDPTSVGLQSWGSSIILARMLVNEPERFGVRSGARVLELGAGTGLLGLTWWAICQKMAERAAEVWETEIVATDFHPAVLANLERNVATNLNAPEYLHAHRDVSLSVQKLDWSAIFNSLQFARSTPSHSNLSTNERRSSLDLSMPAPFDRKFDYLIGADLVYALDHARWIKACVEQFLRKPNREDYELRSEPYFHLLVPIREHHASAIANIAQVFLRRDQIKSLSERGGEYQICVLEQDCLQRTRGVGRVDEGSYRLYRIGWA